ncbi:MAG: hypothetical protein C4334_07665 [Pyrinomonas sp.]
MGANPPDETPRCEQAGNYTRKGARKQALRVCRAARGEGAAQGAAEERARLRVCVTVARVVSGEKSSGHCTLFFRVHEKALPPAVFPLLELLWPVVKAADALCLSRRTNRLLNFRRARFLTIMLAFAIKSVRVSWTLFPQ